MALACEPELLIADEPTTAARRDDSGSDPGSSTRTQARQNMSILMITHDLGVIAEMADSVTVMYASQVVESASVKTLFGNPLHPYTVGLFRSRPRPGSNDALYSIPAWFRAANFPSGCSFHPRCAWCQEPRCTTEENVFREIEPGHMVRCHYAGQIDFSKPLQSRKYKTKNRI